MDLDLDKMIEGETEDVYIILTRQDSYWHVSCCTCPDPTSAIKDATKYLGPEDVYMVVKVSGLPIKVGGRPR